MSGEKIISNDASIPLWNNVWVTKNWISKAMGYIKNAKSSGLGIFLIKREMSLKLRSK
jgi:hypothetical protein